MCLSNSLNFRPSAGSKNPTPPSSNHIKPRARPRKIKRVHKLHCGCSNCRLNKEFPTTYHEFHRTFDDGEFRKANGDPRELEF